jgi:hypothetical protein
MTVDLITGMVIKRLKGRWCGHMGQRDDSRLRQYGRISPHATQNDDQVMKCLFLELFI